MTPGRSRCRSACCGCSRRSSRAGPVSRRRPWTSGRSPQRDTLALRLAARRTWRFFETFVTADGQLLPPDNFQEDPDAGRRPPHLADQYRALSPVGRRGARFRLDRHARRGRAAGSDARDARRSWSAIAAISQLVRHRRPARRWSRATSRRWTAAISPATLIALANACREIAQDTDRRTCMASCGIGDVLRSLARARRFAASAHSETQTALHARAGAISHRCIRTLARMTARQIGRAGCPHSKSGADAIETRQVAACAGRSWTALGRRASCRLR